MEFKEWIPPPGVSPACPIFNGDRLFARGVPKYENFRVSTDKRKFWNLTIKDTVLKNEGMYSCVLAHVPQKVVNLTISSK